MVVRVERTAVQTLDGTTGSVTTSRVTGRILSIKVVTEASIDVKISTINSPSTEFIFGTSSTPIAVSASKVFYPRIIGNLTSDGTNLGANCGCSARLPV